VSLINDTPAITLTDRLEHGFLTLGELCALKLCGKTQVYADIKAGVLKVEKHGRSTRVSGGAAKAYQPGCRAR
jgi:hypothetical protein